MPSEGVATMCRALAYAERTVSLEYPCKRKSGDMYLTERLAASSNPSRMPRC